MTEVTMFKICSSTKAVDNICIATIRKTHLINSLVGTPFPYVFPLHYITRAVKYTLLAHYTEATPFYVLNFKI